MSQIEVELVRKAESRFVNRPTRTGKKLYDKFFIYIPTELGRDSAFPFKEGERIIIEIEGETLVIRKAP